MLELGELMGLKKRRIRPNIWGKFKSHQHITNLMDETVIQEEISTFFIDSRDHKVNKRRRSRIGTFECVKPRIK